MLLATSVNIGCCRLSHPIIATPMVSPKGTQDAGSMPPSILQLAVAAMAHPSLGASKEIQDEKTQHAGPR